MKQFHYTFGTKNIPLEKLLEKEATPLFIPKTKQIHSATVHRITGFEQDCLEGDAFMTDRQGVVCWVRTADCVPILVADPKHGAVAAIHAGWRGTAAGIVTATLQKMAAEWDSRPEDLRMMIGPAIGACCYQVGVEVHQRLGHWCVADTVPDRWRLDLKKANLYFAQSSGVPLEQIRVEGACTCCEAGRYSSYRREGNKRGEQVSYIYAVEE